MPLVLFILAIIVTRDVAGAFVIIVTILTAIFASSLAVLPSIWYWAL